jgi:cytochrome P450
MDFASMSLYRWAASLVALVVFKFTVEKALLIRTAFARIKDYPGRVPLWLNPFGAVALVLGNSFPRPGMVGHYAGKFSSYKKFGATSIASVRISAAQQLFWFADPEAIKLVASDRHTFQKDIVSYEMINIYGGNVVSVEGSNWKRHRSVAMSAFNEANVALIWSETLRVINEWFEQLDAAGPDVAVDMLPPMTQATLLAFATAGFGRRVSWTADSTAEPPPGCRLTFRSAVMDSVNNVIFRALVPGWFYQFSSLIKVPYLSSRALLTQLAFDDLRTHMLDLVASARADITSGERSGASGAALLQNLVEANMNQDGDAKKLTEGELLSNIFAFLLAGHETSSHTLCFAFVLLALYPECQKKIYEEVTRLWPADVSVTQLAGNHKEYMDKLVRFSGVFLTKSAHTDSSQRNTLWHASAKHFVCSLPSLAYQKTCMRILSYLVLISPLDQMRILSKRESFQWLFRRGASLSWIYGHCT